MKTKLGKNIYHKIKMLLTKDNTISDDLNCELYFSVKVTTDYETFEILKSIIIKLKQQLNNEN